MSYKSKLNELGIRYDPDPLTPYEVFQIDNRLTDAEMQFIKNFYVKGKLDYKMPNGEIKTIKLNK